MFLDWIDKAATLADEFSCAEPFPLLVVDGFVETEVAEGLLAEFPSPDNMPKSRDYMFGDKRELSSVAEQGPISKQFYDALVGPPFQTFVSTLTGKDLFVDPAFHGGGFHQSADGGYLDSHVDFNMHPLHADWLRTLNILLYLNKDWKPEYNGRLQLRTSPEGDPLEIEPLFNRAVLMVTDESTYHGFERMVLPTGVTRKSIATYAYEKIVPGTVQARTTGWAPQNAGPIKRQVAARYNSLVQLKTKFLGSATAKNR